MFENEHPVWSGYEMADSWLKKTLTSSVCERTLEIVGHENKAPSKCLPLCEPEIGTRYVRGGIPVGLRDELTHNKTIRSHVSHQRLEKAALPGITPTVDLPKTEHMCGFCLYQSS